MQPKKSLGQNFLTSEAAVHKIVTAAKISAGETVLEVGPGRGVLTSALLGSGAKVVAVEKDHALISELEVKFSEATSEGKLKIVEGDALEILPNEIGLPSRTHGGYKIVANLPYYITGQFLKKFLSETAAENQPMSMVLLLQKEVVERIIASDKKGSILSISIKAYGEPHKITVVKSGSFFPAPSVDSAVIAIENISKNFFTNVSEEKFFEVVKAGFAHKRKMLVPNLAQIFEKEKVLKVFSDLNISEKIRAEDIVLGDWKKIAEEIQK